MRGRPAHQRERVRQRAEQMRAEGAWVNKSKIARDLGIPICTVFRALRGQKA
jgi:hypothetical protein